VMRSLRLFPAEWITLGYLVLTGLCLLLFAGRLEAPLPFFGFRLGATGLVLVLAGMARIHDRRWLLFVRHFLPFLLLGYLYSETYFFRGFFLSGQDAFFFQADAWLFGGQPSQAFSMLFPMRWFSELMYAGYFSYYLLFLGVPLWYWFRRPELFPKAVFVLLGSFYLYYLIFIVLPVAGPQFYLPPSLATAPDGYFFSDLVHLIQEHGEKPTGAFPSSHVGVTVVALLLAYFPSRRLFVLLLPVALLLMCSTVYIKAHYAVDVPAGIITGIVFYIVVSKSYSWFGKH